MLESARHTVRRARRRVQRVALGTVLPRRAYIRHPDSVTTRGAEVDPASVGLDAADVEAIWDAVVQYYRIGLQPALSLCIRRHGEVVLDRAIGFAQGAGPDDAPDAERVQATPDTLFNLFSGSKAVTATLVHALADDGIIDLDAPVARYLPGFGKHGKDRILVRHVLCHQAGLPETPADAIDLDLLDDHDRLVRILGDQVPLTAPGEEVAYHAVTGGFLLGAIMREATGECPRALLRRRLLDPLGIDSLSFGVDPSDLPNVASEAFTGPLARAPFSTWMKRSLGIPFEDAIAIANDPRFLTGVVPSGNVIGTANDASKFFEMLLRGGTLDGTRVLSQGALARALAPQNDGRQQDRIIKLPIRYGLGYMLGDEMVSFYGPGTPAAFGHLGFTNVLAWADPERDISVALMNNGKPFITPELVAWMRIMWTIAARIPRRRGLLVAA
ncbi:MAG: CubicO group peptidase (beta-lactamase class C family) [Myxococcota bacterium]|jgi:CubicO group peptidase (beta-lactamase class C family)